MPPRPIAKCIYGFDSAEFDLPTQEALYDLNFKDDDVEYYM